MTYCRKWLRIIYMYRSKLFLSLLAVFIISCKSPPQAVEKPPEENNPVIIAEPAAEPIAEPEPVPEIPDTHEVSQEIYDNTLAEVKLFINSLNKIISAKNYNGWKNALSDEYFTQISSQEFLANASESPLLKTKKIVLKTPNDYFTNVVVPSRANSRVDEIEFSDDNKVKAYYLETRTKKDGNETVTETRRLRIYELTKSGDEWKIAN